ncbi:hypothetical protein WJU23_05240 [Prosthecobacter sp. SYSU 5D2]|uniref:hypothetical protein n=1 Tax=Prosthecobacter sp. SYSU 5D2 TaxID=3134134 RepID=UPI0031FF24A6
MNDPNVQHIRSVIAEAAPTPDCQCLGARLWINILTGELWVRKLDGSWVKPNEGGAEE